MKKALINYIKKPKFDDIYTPEYTIYKSDNFLFMGTKKECANNTIYEGKRKEVKNEI